MKAEEVRRFFELRKLCAKRGLRLFLARSHKERKRGYAWIDTGPGSEPIVYFETLAEVEEHLQDNAA